jgi:glycosyltransferase involved in cell wall biosynthesis
MKLECGELGSFMKDTNVPLLAVVSSAFPPQVSGSAILLDNLLSGFRGRTVVLAGFDTYSQVDSTFADYYGTIPLYVPRRFPRVNTQLRVKLPSLAYRVLEFEVRRILRNQLPHVVLAAYPYDTYLVATFLAATSLNTPFYAYMHDLWIENTTRGTPLGDFARKWESRILKEATRVLCMTEAMQDHYHRKYGIRADLMPHAISRQTLVSAPSGILPSQTAKPTVLFVGTVSPPMNLDALKKLAAAAELLPDEYEIIFCTPSSIASLRDMGISTTRVKVKYLARPEVQALQSRVNVLIAPLSHKNCSADEVRTVFSTKLLEYLVSGRPIIIFGPEGCYHVDSARNGRWAHVVTEDSPVALAKAIVEVTKNDRLSSMLVQGALKEAKARDAKFFGEKLYQWIIADALGGAVNNPNARRRAAESRTHE